MTAAPSPEKPLAIAIGDPAGIGPEIIANAWVERDAHSLPPFFVVGGSRVLKNASEQRGIELPIVAINSPLDAHQAFVDGLPVLGELDAEYQPGHPDSSGAKLALASLEAATSLTLEGKAGALVTAPVAKAELARIGFSFPGQTEYLAQACCLPAQEAVMMLAGPSLRTVPLTVHCALAEVPNALSIELICHKARIVDRALSRDFGIARPRLAICGLNPHAGEAGRFGNEEQRIITPAIEALRGEGIDATGPHPADALFTPRARSGYHAALCMYHDQALIPLKAIEFDEGVNATLGLPIIRTSPDHGTAFGIAGKGLADAGAMIAAIQMAGDMIAKRAQHG